MGYYITWWRSDIYIPAKDADAVHQALVDLANDVHRNSESAAKREDIDPRLYPWVDTGAVRLSKTLEEALSHWGWEIDSDKDGSLIDFYFTKSQKSGGELVLFSTIAPWVKDGSYIMVFGEDDEIWRWYFKDGACKEQKASLVFRDNVEAEDCR